MRRYEPTHPGVVQQARHFLVAKQGQDLSWGAGGDGEVIEEQPVRAVIGRAGGSRGGRQPIRCVARGSTGEPCG